MPKTIKVKVYEYDELNEIAKEKARQWFLEGTFNYDWYEFIYEDAKRAGFDITSFDIYSHDIKGKIIDSCEAIAKHIIKDHGKDCETFKNAKNYLKDLKALGTIPDLMPGYTENEEKSHDDKVNEYDEKKEELDEEFFNTILNDYLSILKKEVDYMESKEYIEDGIRANEYTFTNDGKRFG